MNSTLSKVLYFAAGAAIGSAVTWKILKTKYERKVQEEIDSVKESLEKFRQTQQSEPEVDQLSMDFEEEYEPTPDEFTDEEKNQYENYADRYISHSNNKEEVKSMDGPYVIAPEEFGENSDYETESLTYYADKVLTDEWDNIVEDYEELIGADALTHFGEYEEDSVFVRNDEFKTDYEILLDERNFADIPKRKSTLGGE